MSLSVANTYWEYIIPNGNTFKNVPSKNNIKIFKFIFQAEHIKDSSGGYQSVLSGAVLESDEGASEILCVTPTEISDNVLGCFTINWKRYKYIGYLGTKWLVILV